MFRRRKKHINMSLLDLRKKENVEHMMNHLQHALFKQHQNIIMTLADEENHLIPNKAKIWTHQWIAKDEAETIMTIMIENATEQIRKRFGKVL